MRVHEVRERAGRAVRQLVLQQAALNRNQLMAAFPVEAGDGAPVLFAHGEDALVAVAVDLIAADDFRSGHVLLPDAL